MSSSLEVTYLTPKVQEELLCYAIGDFQRRQNSAFPSKINFYYFVFTYSTSKYTANAKTILQVAVRKRDLCGRVHYIHTTDDLRKGKMFWCISCTELFHIKTESRIK
jgi:hypothetical protein